MLDCIMVINKDAPYISTHFQSSASIPSDNITIPSPKDHINETPLQS